MPFYKATSANLKTLWYTAEVKIGNKTYIGCRKLLRKARKIKRKQVLQHLLIFPSCNFAIDFRVLLCLAAGYVLRHQAYQHLLLKILLLKAKHFHTVFRVHGQY